MNQMEKDKKIMKTKIMISNPQVLNQKKVKNKKRDKSCDTYIFVFFVFLIHSLISYGFYYLCYILKFDFEGVTKLLL